MSEVIKAKSQRKRQADVEPWAVILAGGLGTRLRPLVSGLPKAMAPVWGRPFLSFVLDWLQCQGINKVVLCIGYMGRMVEACYGLRYGRMQLFYSREKELLGTGGALGPAARMVGSTEMLVLNGDSLCLADLQDFFSWHRRNRAAASLVTCFCRNSERFGSVIAGQDGRVTGFAEKTGRPAAGWINAGIYLFKTAMLAQLEYEKALSLEKDILPQLVGRNLFAYRTKADFIDIGIPHDYLKAPEFFDNLPTNSGIGRPADKILTPSGLQR